MATIPPVDLDVEIQRTKPDFIVYRPKSADGSTFDTGNEHFLVFDGPDGALMAVWTQSSREGEANQRIVFARSDDEGETWTEPMVLAGPVKPGQGRIASWGFPMVSKTGRIYVLFNKHTGKVDTFFHTTGLMAGMYSDDCGRTWSEPEIIPMPRSCYDNPDPSYPSNWIVWQKPLRLSEGRYFAGFTRWISSAVRHKPPVNSWIACESVVEFMRFENLDDHPEPKDLEVCYFMSNEKALRVPFPGHPEMTVCQEPSVVALPDGRLFCVMRTTMGCPYWTVSADAGRTWAEPRPLRQKDGGDKLKHPLSPCPIYALGGGRYVFLFHNHDGHFEKWGPLDTTYHRRPLFLALGEFREKADQPVWFAEPKFLMDNDGVLLGPAQRCDLAMYASFTIRNGQRVLWYPDRKFFLLGKKITDEFLSDCKAPT